MTKAKRYRIRDGVAVTNPMSAHSLAEYLAYITREAPRAISVTEWPPPAALAEETP